jgi:hypothetical protein
MPDAFFFATWGDAANCSIPAEDMHNPITAGYILQYALSMNGQKYA